MLSLLLTLAGIGVILWLVNTYIPMAPPIKSIINVIVAIFAVLLTLQAFGILGSFPRGSLRW